MENILKFKGNLSKVLICNDANIKGIHFGFEVTVVQFDLPLNAIYILNRFGKCGKYREEGIVISFFGKLDVKKFEKFQEQFDSLKKIKSTLFSSESYNELID